jgi:hypothetical protein
MKEMAGEKRMNSRVRAGIDLPTVGGSKAFGVAMSQ